MRTPNSILFLMIAILFILPYGCGSSSSSNSSDNNSPSQGTTEVLSENSDLEEEQGSIDDTGTEADTDFFAGNTAQDDVTVQNDIEVVDTDPEEEPEPEPEEEIETRYPPETTIYSGPPGYFEGNHFVEFYWDGDDIDGEVVSYRFNLEGPISTDGWTSPSDDTFLRVCIRASGDYLFSVKAIDDDGIEDSTPATYSFSAENCST